MLVLLQTLTMQQPATPAGPPQPTIDVEQARALVIASLTPGQKRLPKVEAEGYKPPEASRFWFFTAVWDNPAKASVVLGTFAVDPYTGDVFSAAAECYEYRSKALKAVQAQVRAKLHLSQVRYQKLKTKGPLCG